MVRKILRGKWDAEWDYGADFEEDDFDWDDVECVVEDIDYSGVFEEWEVELACGLGELDPAPK